MISCHRLRTPDSFAESSCQSAACSAVAAYSSCLNTAPCTCPCCAAVTKNSLLVSQDYLGAKTPQFFSSGQCGGCLAVPVPSWLSTLWKGLCTVQVLAWQACTLALHFTPWFCREPIEEKSQVVWWSHWWAVATKLLKNMSLRLTFSPRSPNSEMLWQLLVSWETFWFCIKESAYWFWVWWTAF